MNVLIIGCGKVGSRLASVLDSSGYDVCVVDRNKERFHQLDNHYSGYTVAGVPIDRDVLKRAGIEGSDAVIAVTEDDNVNIMVCQVAREVFHVDMVLARIYDPKRGNVFSHFNLQTICPTNLTVDAVCAALERGINVKRLQFGSSTVSYYVLPVSRKQVGKYPSDVMESEYGRLFAIEHTDGVLEFASSCRHPLKADDRLVYAKLSN